MTIPPGESRGESHNPLSRNCQLSTKILDGKVRIPIKCLLFMAGGQILKRQMKPKFWGFGDSRFATARGAV